MRTNDEPDDAGFEVLKRCFESGGAEGPFHSAAKARLRERAIALDATGRAQLAAAIAKADELIAALSRPRGATGPRRTR